VRAENGESFSALLRRYRLGAGLSQEELAAQSGLSVRTIGFMEAGRTSRPYRRSVRMLADALALADAESAAFMRAAGRGFALAGPDGQAALAGQLVINPPVQGVAPLVVRPAELPADIADFTGRSGHISRLTGLLAGRYTGGPVPVAVITGSGGMGKSALAVHVAHQLRTDFGDGQLFVELRGSGDKPVSSADALARLLRQLGRPDAELPADEAERAALYRTRLADRRLLVLLDDARDAAQVRPLLPGTAASAVIVTSRSWLADLEGGQRVALEELDDTEALALLTLICGPDRVGNEPAATRAVLAACAGLPLAVRIVAARLVSRPGWTIRTLAERLADQRKRLEELAVGDLAVRASFQVSYATLARPGRSAGPAGAASGAASGDCGRAFRLLGLWPGADISLPAAAALLGLDQDAAFRTLEKLVDVHMLQAHCEARYRFHDLIGAFAIECALRDEPSASAELAVRRVLSWYTHTAHQALELFQLPPSRRLTIAGLVAGVRALDFADQDAAADWADSERANISCAVMLAARLGLHESCAQLAEVVWRCQLRSPWDGWMAVLDQGVASARLAGDTASVAWLLNYLGIVLMYRGQTLDAMTCLTQALPQSRQAGDRQCEAALTGNLAIACKELKRYDEAIAHLERASEIEHDPQPRRRGTTLVNLGMLQVEVGRVTEGVSSMEQALTLFRGLGDRTGDAFACARLSDAYRRLGRHSDAIESALSAVEISERNHDLYTKTCALQALGLVYADCGDRERARSYLASAHLLSGKLGLPETEQIAAAIGALADAGTHPAVGNI
jgi:tetratricopeptide (TPR) repeat protein/DNA-binding XRE family transcriptional regulator